MHQELSNEALMIQLHVVLCVNNQHDAQLLSLIGEVDARKFPVLLDHLTSGALHLCGVALLAPHLTPDNGSDLIGACLNQSKRRIELMLASRFCTEDGANGRAPGRMDPIGNEQHRVRATFDQSQHDK